MDGIVDCKGDEKVGDIPLDYRIRLKKRSLISQVPGDEEHRRLHVNGSMRKERNENCSYGGSKDISSRRKYFGLGTGTIHPVMDPRPDGSCASLQARSHRHIGLPLPHFKRPSDRDKTGHWGRSVKDFRTRGREYLDFSRRCPNFSGAFTRGRKYQNL